MFPSLRGIIRWNRALQRAQFGSNEHRRSLLSFFVCSSEPGSIRACSLFLGNLSYILMTMKFCSVFRNINLFLMLAIFSYSF